MRGLCVDIVKKSLWIFSDSAIFQYHVTKESRYLQVFNWLTYENNKIIILGKSTVTVNFIAKSTGCKVLFPH